jgi:hypothetical protein
MTDTTGMVNIGNEDGLSRFFDIRHDSDMNEFESKTLVTQDYVPTITENYWHQVNGGNGWTKDRTMRKVAQVPSLALQIAADEGWNLDDQNELRRWLDAHPEFLTVKAIHTRGGSANIIVK